MENIFLVNPVAGNGITLRIWPKIEASLKKSLGSFKFYFTSGRGDATKLTKQILARYPVRIVAVGGDGHLNEVLNGFIFDDAQICSKSCLSFIMTGTGCDFQRSFSLSRDVQVFVDNLKENPVRKIDVGKVTFKDFEKKKKIRYFINVASFGLSGAVDYSMKDPGILKHIGGKSLFLFTTLKTIFSHPNQVIRYSIDGREWNETKTRLGVLANGRFFGGGMCIAPEAELDDGFLDLLILKETSVPKFLMHLPKIYQGTHILIPEIFYTKAKKFDVSSQEKVPLDIDGEFPGYLDASFEILPKILNIQI